MPVGIPAFLLLTAGQSLQLCARHGDPATRHRRVVFKSKPPAWTYLLIPFGLLPFAVVAMVLEKRVEVPAWPFCARCRKLRWGRLLGGVGLVLFAILAMVVLAVVLGDGGTGTAAVIVVAFLALLVTGLTLAANTGWPHIASAHASGDGGTVEVRKADRRFADQAAALQQAAQQQWMAQQQWAVPQGYAPAQQWHPQHPQHQPHEPHQPQGSGGVMPS